MRRRYLRGTNLRKSQYKKTNGKGGKGVMKGDTVIGSIIWLRFFSVIQMDLSFKEFSGTNKTYSMIFPKRLHRNTGQFSAVGLLI